MPDRELGDDASGKVAPRCPAALPFALDIAPGALLLLLREPLGWREIARAPLDADGEVSNASRLVRAARCVVRDGPLTAEVWLPVGQVMVLREVLPEERDARVDAAFDLIAQRSGQPREELALAISPPLPDGRTTILATFGQSCREARAYSEGWGFTPRRVSTSVAAADFCPAGAEFRKFDVCRAAASMPPGPATGEPRDATRETGMASPPSLVGPGSQSAAHDRETRSDANPTPASASGASDTVHPKLASNSRHTKLTPAARAAGGKGRRATPWLAAAGFASVAVALAAGVPALRNQPEAISGGMDATTASPYATARRGDGWAASSSFDAAEDAKAPIATLANSVLPEPLRPLLPNSEKRAPIIEGDATLAPASLAPAMAALPDRALPSAALRRPEVLVSDTAAMAAALQPTPDERLPRSVERNRLGPSMADDLGQTAPVLRSGWHPAPGSAMELPTGGTNIPVRGDPSTAIAGKAAGTAIADAEERGDDLRLAQAAPAGEDVTSNFAPVTSAVLPAARPEPAAAGQGPSLATENGEADEPVLIPAKRNYGYAPVPTVTPIENGAAAALGTGEQSEANAVDTVENDDTISTLAALSAPVPKGRPAGLATPIRPSDRAERARRSPLPNLARAAPQAVQRASIAEGVPLDRAALIGILNLDNGRQALLRLPNGRYERVLVGDQLDGWEVSMIGTDAIRLERGDEERTLLLVDR